jgi:hypothetical protein
MTTISIRLSEHRPLATNAWTTARAAWTRAGRWVQSTWCVVNGGHYKVLHTAPDRMALRCVACGHTSPGWEVGSPRFARAIPASPERLRARRQTAA